MFSHPLLALGFRPFFLVAGVFATLWVPLWLAVWRGLLPVPSYFGPIGWHRHEMLFGYALAVIAGFLMTAAGNWTGRPMPSGGGGGGGGQRRRARAGAGLAARRPRPRRARDAVHARSDRADDGGDGRARD